jgi:DNA-directed RNA polymerase subunit RPC12/RpoP
MANPVITCPECSKQFKGKGDLQGKKIRCPFCHEPFTVPEAEEDEPAPKPAAKKAAVKAAPKPPPFKPMAGDDDDDDNPNPYGVTKLDIAPRCPNCANEMESEEAVVCLYCGYNTLTRTWGKTAKVIEMTAGEHLMWLLPGLACALTIFLLIVFLIAYCLVVPYYSANQWYEFADHESIRMWLTTIMLGIMWGTGYFAFKRLVINPTPPDKLKD